MHYNVLSIPQYMTLLRKSDLSNQSSLEAEEIVKCELWAYLLVTSNEGI